MATWRRASRLRSSWRGRHSSSGRRRAEPIPEHGASTSTRSNVPRRAGAVASCARTDGCSPRRDGARAHQLGALRMQIGRDHAPAVPHQAREVRGLAAGPRARVEHTVARAARRAPRRRTPMPDPGRRTIRRPNRGTSSGRPRRAGMQSGWTAARTGCEPGLAQRAPRAPPAWWRTGSRAARGTRAPRSPPRRAPPRRDPASTRRSSATAHGSIPGAHAPTSRSVARGPAPADPTRSLRSTALTKPRSRGPAELDGLPDGRVRGGVREQELVGAQAQRRRARPGSCGPRGGSRAARWPSPASGGDGSCRRRARRRSPGRARRARTAPSAAGITRFE